MLLPLPNTRLDIRLIMGNSDVEAKSGSHPPWLISGRDVSSPLGKVTNIDVDINCLLRLMKSSTLRSSRAWECWSGGGLRILNLHVEPSPGTTPRVGAMPTAPLAAQASSAPPIRKYGQVELRRGNSSPAIVVSIRTRS